MYFICHVYNNFINPENCHVINYNIWSRLKYMAGGNVYIKAKELHLWIPLISNIVPKEMLVNKNIWKATLAKKND